MPIAVTSSGRPTNYPISLAEAKTHLKVDHTDEDAYIVALVKAVTSKIENYLDRPLLNTQFQWVLDAFPCDSVLYIPKPKLVSIDSITYLASSDGNSTSWGSTYYNVDTISQPGRLEPAYDETWPTNVRTQNNAVTIKFTAGYGTTTTDIPEDILLGMKMLLTHVYENRQDVIVGTSYQVELTKGSEFFLHDYRNYYFEGY